MYFTENNLMEDESLIRATRLHPIVLLVPAMMVSVLAGSLSIVHDVPVVFYAVALLVLGATYRFLDRLILFMTSEFAVTSKRVLGKTGFVRLKTLDIVLAKVEAIRIDQTILGRLFDFGDVEVTGTGGTEEVLRFIPGPLEFSKAIQEQLSALEEAKSDDTDPRVRQSGR